MNFCYNKQADVYSLGRAYIALSRDLHIKVRSLGKLMHVFLTLTSVIVVTV